MKITILIYLIFYFPHLLAQDLRNTEWTQVKIERKDGSKILDRLGTENSITKYYFREKTVLFSNNNIFTEELTYTIDNKILSIGEFSKYKIDTVDREILVLTQIANKELTDDKINRFIFINRHSLFEYLKENGNVEIIGDSLIKSNSQFAPTYYGNIDKLFMHEFDSHNSNKKISGTYILSSKGKIENIEFDDNNKFTKKEKAKFNEIIISINGSWTLPETCKSFKYKVDFGIDFTSIQSFSGVRFYYPNKVLIKEMTKSLTLNEMKESDDYFNKGNALISNEKYEKASKQFIKCLEIDSLYLDAYYNLAFCYQRLGNLNLACKTWNTLKIMGQKQGEFLYNENCK